MDEATEIFESQRSALFRLAYGMLGRIAPAEDVVQESFIRWQKRDFGQVRNPKAYLSTIVSRLCLDEIKSAKNHREQYIGPYLPEPVMTSNMNGPDDKMELNESLSMAMHVVLEQLTPVQRAVFILREIFDYDYASVAEMIDKSEAHCRKIAQRARDEVRGNKPQFERSTPGQHELVATFIEAVQQGDLSEIESMLAEEAIMYSDGGGKVTAARKPVKSAAKIAKFLVGIQKQVPESSEWEIDFMKINGEPGMVLWLDGELFNAWSFHIENGVIQGIYVVLNPDKLEHVREMLGESSH